jgi:hypothetical protein
MIARSWNGRYTKYYYPLTDLMNPALLPVTSSVIVNTTVIVSVVMFQLTGVTLILVIAGAIVINALAMMGVYVIGSRLARRRNKQQ